MNKKVFAFFPEAAFGPALNSVGIAQAVERMGHEAVFISDPGFVDVYKGYGFRAYPVNLSEPMPAEKMAKFWEDFINGHIPNFRKAPIDQIENYVKECWEAIVDSSKWAQKDLPSILESIQPDVIAVDNVILFPAIKQYGSPWVRIISCSENEIEDENIPPHLSGMSENDKEGHKAFREKFNEVIKPIHDDLSICFSVCCNLAAAAINSLSPTSCPNESSMVSLIPMRSTWSPRGSSPMEAMAFFTSSAALARSL